MVGCSCRSERHCRRLVGHCCRCHLVLSGKSPKLPKKGRSCWEPVCWPKGQRLATFFLIWGTARPLWRGSKKTWVRNNSTSASAKRSKLYVAQSIQNKIPIFVCIVNSIYRSIEGRAKIPRGIQNTQVWEAYPTIARGTPHTNRHAGGTEEGGIKTSLCIQISCNI